MADPANSATSSDLLWGDVKSDLEIMSQIGNNSFAEHGDMSKAFDEKIAEAQIIVAKIGTESG